MALLKLEVQHIDLLDCHKQSDTPKATKTNADLLLVLGDDLSEEDEASRISDDFIKTSSSGAMEAAKADVDHVKEHNRQAQDTIQAQKRQIHDMQNTMNMVQAELQEQKRRSDMAGIPISKLKEKCAKAFATLIQIRREVTGLDLHP